MWSPADRWMRPFQPLSLPHTKLTSLIHNGFVLIKNRQFFKNLLAAIVLLISSGRTDGTCNEEQIEICRESALDGRLAALRSGGLCSPRHYAEFSHLCSVTNYLPSVEYCCCIFETNVLCCRYHQDWNLFRCQLEEDLIDSTTGSEDLLNGEDDDEQTTLCCPPLELLLPAILVPLVVVACCLYVCFKYWAVGGQCCGNGGGGGSEGLCCPTMQADDDLHANISPRKNRRANDLAAASGDIALSASLSNSDANSTLPLTSCSTPRTTTTTNHIQPSSTPDKPGPYPPRCCSSEDPDHQPSYDLVYHAGPHPRFPVEPTAPPLFDDLEPASSCAFSHCYHEPHDPLDELYPSPARHRDSGGRALPLYRNGRSFSSGGGRCSAPLVHRVTPGHYHFRSKYDRTASCRLASCPIRACSASPPPPPPSYEQSCNQNL